MMTVYKYPFDIAAKVDLYMPAGSRLLSVQIQDGAACCWALVYSKAEARGRRLIICGTGLPCAGVGGLPFVGTIQQDEVVNHVFDAGEFPLSLLQEDDDEVQRRESQYVRDPRPRCPKCLSINTAPFLPAEDQEQCIDCRHVFLTRSGK